MNENELRAAIASVTRHLERVGVTSSEAARSLANAAATMQMSMSRIATGSNNHAIGSSSYAIGTYVPAQEQVSQLKEEQPEPPQYVTLNYEKEVSTTMLDSEYLTVYDPLKCDWDT